MLQYIKKDFENITDELKAHLKLVFEELVANLKQYEADLGLPESVEHYITNFIFVPESSAGARSLAGKCDIHSVRRSSENAKVVEAVFRDPDTNESHMHCAISINRLLNRCIYKGARIRTMLGLLYTRIGKDCNIAVGAREDEAAVEADYSAAACVLRCLHQLPFLTETDKQNLNIIFGEHPITIKSAQNKMKRFIKTAHIHDPVPNEEISQTVLEKEGMFLGIHTSGICQHCVLIISARHMSNSARSDYDDDCRNGIIFDPVDGIHSRCPESLATLRIQGFLEVREVTQVFLGDKKKKFLNRVTALKDKGLKY